MTAETHFIQHCAGPVFIGPDDGVLDCSCGRRLIEGYAPARFLAVGIQCGECATLTMTPGLPVGEAPPFAVVIAEPVAEPRVTTTTLPAQTYVIGRAEMDRIGTLFRPVTPSDNLYRITPDLLDEAEAVFGLPSLPAASADPFAGVKQHAVAWAVRHLRGRLAEPGWDCRDSAATSAACANVTAFLHFVRTWSHHPLYMAMAATAGNSGFSLHGMAPFAAAHCLSMQGNRIGFPVPVDGRIGSFLVATGPTETVLVHTDVFDRFEYPYGRPWDAATLRGAVGDVVAGIQGRINLRNPGLLLLSPGIALAGFDEALIVAVRDVVPVEGRKNRGLMAVAPIVLRMQAVEPHSLRFGYGLFPVPNRHYRGETLVQAAG